MRREGACLSGIDYSEALAKAAEGPYARAVAVLREELPPLWRNAYRAFSTRPTELVSIERGDFEFLFDDYTGLEARGVVPYDPHQESRVVAVYGCSAPPRLKRDDHRLRGWVGATERMFGTGWDKGHFIAHSIGGAVLGSELNVFVQRRALNRGWSTEGKRYRAMEDYCASNSGTFCFARPIYTDGSAQPAYVELGLLRSDGELRVECFDNR
jgi:hypothetical protein